MRQGSSEARTKWIGLLSEQRQSGQSVAAFCSERGLHPWRFYEWRKRLRAPEGARFLEVKVARSAAPALPAVVRGGAIEIRLHNGRSLFVESGFDGSHLRALLSILEAEA